MVDRRRLAVGFLCAFAGAAYTATALLEGSVSFARTMGVGDSLAERLVVWARLRPDLASALLGASLAGLVLVGVGVVCAVRALGATATQASQS
jgi:hypothetical protein